MNFDQDYGSMASARSPAIEGGGASRTLINFDCPTGVSWQAWIFCDGASTCGSLIDFDFSGGYSADGTIRSAVGPQGGDIIAGTGPCRVTMITDPTATAVQNSTISIWFVPESNYRNLPPFAENFTIAGAGSFQWLNQTGFPPFGRYKLSVYSPANFDLEMRGAAGGIQQITPIASPNIANLPIFISPLTRVRVANTVANQVFAVVFSE